MPAILTHYSFASDMLSHCSSSFQKAIFIGTQGPDPFFFYGQLPWKRRSKDHLEVNRFGSFLHHTDIAPIYSAMMKIASNSKDKELYFAYIEGLWLHYCLDRECHAYIFPSSGFSSDPIVNKRYGVLHTYFETMIDSLISTLKGIYTVRPQKYLSISRKELRKISLLWYKTNLETLNDPSIHENTFYLSLKDYRSVLRLTNTPHYFSKAFITLISGKDSLPSAMNIPNHIPSKLSSVDFLNKNHSSWPDMVNGKKHTESFFELEDLAKRDFIEVHRLIERAKSGEDVLKELSLFVGSICHDGCNPSLQKRFAKPRWPLSMLPQEEH